MKSSPAGSRIVFHRVGSRISKKRFCEVDPEKPSTAAYRNADEGLNVRKQAKRQLSGDLDNIVLNVMRKEPQRRYDSAAALSEDLRRHLEALPILAQADRWGRRMSQLTALGAAIDRL
jgi:eukaryotic-like serine/threonine-protein kinase